MSEWTLTELVEIAARALAADDVRVASARVTEVPNERLVRWYSTIGLVDRPAIGRGRLARYGERQLAQLVAVKRLQAQGLSLVEIQQRLLGATDGELRRIADLPADLPPTPIPVEYSGDKFRVSAPSSVHKVGVKPAEAAGEIRSGDVEGSAGGMLASPAAASAFWEARPTRRTDAPTPVFGVSLRGLTLLLPVQPNPADLDAIASAATPLIDLLASRGLLEPNGDHQ